MYIYIFILIYMFIIILFIILKKKRKKRKRSTWLNKPKYLWSTNYNHKNISIFAYSPDMSFFSFPSFYFIFSFSSFSRLLFQFFLHTSRQLHPSATPPPLNSDHLSAVTCSSNLLPALSTALSN